jgi:hypothetical protein
MWTEKRGNSHTILRTKEVPSFAFAIGIGRTRGEDEADH